MSLCISESLNNLIFSVSYSLRIWFMFSYKLRALTNLDQKKNILHVWKEKYYNIPMFGSPMATSSLHHVSPLWLDTLMVSCSLAVSHTQYSSSSTLSDIDEIALTKVLPKGESKYDTGGEGEKGLSQIHLGLCL